MFARLHLHKSFSKVPQTSAQGLSSLSSWYRRSKKVMGPWRIVIWAILMRTSYMHLHLAKISIRRPLI
jgi:hypothetical protein